MRCFTMLQGRVFHVVLLHHQKLSSSLDFFRTFGFVKIDLLSCESPLCWSWNLEPLEKLPSSTGWSCPHWGKILRSLQWFWCAFWVGGTQLAGFVYRVPAETNDFLAVEAIHTNPVSRILGKNSLRMLCFMLEQTVEVLNSDENLLKMHWSFRCMASKLGWSLSKFPRKFATYLRPVAKNCLVSAKIVVLKHCLSVFFWTGAQNVNKHVDFCSVLWCAWSSWRIFLWKERSPSPFYCECTSDRQTYA